VGKEAAAGRHWKWQSFLRPTLLVEAEFQILLLLWLASCPQAVITILGLLMLMITVCMRSPPPPPNPLTPGELGLKPGPQIPGLLPGCLRSRPKKGGDH
jgi:hypothetical protein